MKELRQLHVFSLVRESKPGNDRLCCETETLQQSGYITKKVRRPYKNIPLHAHCEETRHAFKKGTKAYNCFKKQWALTLALAVTNPKGKHL